MAELPVAHCEMTYMYITLSDKEFSSMYIRLLLCITPGWGGWGGLTHKKNVFYCFLTLLFLFSWLKHYEAVRTKFQVNWTFLCLFMIFLSPLLIVDLLYHPLGKNPIFHVLPLPFV